MCVVQCRSCSRVVLVGGIVKFLILFWAFLSLLYFSIWVGGGRCGLTCIAVCACMFASLWLWLRQLPPRGNCAAMATERKPMPFMVREEANSCCSGWLYLFELSTHWRRGGWMKQGISSLPPPPTLSLSLHIFQSSPIADIHTNVSIMASGMLRRFVGRKMRTLTAAVVLFC